MIRTEQTDNLDLGVCYLKMMCSKRMFSLYPYTQILTHTHTHTHAHTIRTMHIQYQVHTHVDMHHARA
jgi:hypothetical protein